MSERILKALMHLFAIISGPHSEGRNRREIVESFLMQQLNIELVEEYLKIYDAYFELYQKKQSNEDKLIKSISFSSVKVLRICTEINAELTQKQKLVVLVRLLEFIGTEKIISPQEAEFVATVSDIFHIDVHDFNRINRFVLSYSFHPDDYNYLLSINSASSHAHFKNHITAEGMDGEMNILFIPNTNMYFLIYKGKGEINLNGQIIEPGKIHVLTPGSSIRSNRMKPVYYTDISILFNRDQSKYPIVFQCINVVYEFGNGQIGLNDITFTEQSGRLIGIMGASGAGKSTLLHVLNGQLVPTQGEVLINNVNIHSEKEKIEGLIGFVSQDDLLIEELTVFENLYFNAKLCFDHYSHFQLIRVVCRMLQNLGLYEIKDMVVGNPMNKKISGGQRKRLNIALELIREPSVLFLDEPTSGLSSRDSENIMDLLKDLCRKGKMIFVVIHQPSSDIFKLFDRLLLLDTGGYLIFNGDPVESIVYFKSKSRLANWNDSECRVCGNVNPEQVFSLIDAHVVDEYGNLTRTRKTSPKEWYLYHKRTKSGSADLKKIPEALPPISFKIPNRFKQFKVFAIRDTLSKLSNRQYLVINILETPLLAFLLAFIVKYYTVDVANEFGYTLSGNPNLPVYIFMSVIVAIFIGLTVSAEEIIKDQRILKREAFLNLSRSSYLLSKLAILLLISAFQAWMFVLIGNSIMEIKGMYWAYWIILFSSWSFANILGLNISDTFKTVVTIYILIPFLVIPQLILSGIIVPYDKLNPKISSPGKIPLYGEIITARWAYEGLAVYQFTNNDYQRNFFWYDKAMSECDYKKNYWLRALNNKINDCERFLIDTTYSKAKIISNLQLVSNELKKEEIENPKIPFHLFYKLTIDSLNQHLIDQLRLHLEKLNQFYIRRYNKANELKDNLISTMQNTEAKRLEFILLKKQHYNQNLYEVVCNLNSIERIVEYDGRLYQKINPVYQDPENYFIKAHFYAARKKVFGFYIHTFYVNLIVIWVMNFLLYITLYFQVLKKILMFFSNQDNRLGKWFFKLKKNNHDTPVSI